MNSFDAYPSFADFIASDPELSVYRRFDRLSSRNLLYLQNELLELQARLTGFDEEDYNEKNGDVILAAKCWENLAEKEESPREKKRIETIRKIRVLMKEYQEALVLRGQVLNLQKPGNRVFGVFAGWFNKTRPFVGYGKNLLEEHNDFVALGAIEDQDRLSTFIRDLGGKCLPGFRHANSSEVKYYSGSTVYKIIAGISIIMAALLLEGAIVALYFVTSPGARLGLIGLFMVLFAGSIGLLSNAKRSEMFAATAAYTAVLVVFVSSNLGGC